MSSRVTVALQEATMVSASIQISKGGFAIQNVSMRKESKGALFGPRVTSSATHRQRRVPWAWEDQNLPGSVQLELWRAPPAS
jgi:hypothetical protein